MELMYPIAIILALAIGIAIFFINLNSKNKYTDGKKVANTKYIKETDYYKEKIVKYKKISRLIKISYLLCILGLGVLIARPVKIQTSSEDKFNRDIILSIDVSSSENEVNYEFVKQFRSIIPNIEGDRIGIVIFNTAPVVYCPLTEDYNFIDEKLKILEDLLKEVIETNSFTQAEREILMGGVIANNMERGSSLIGDGLARNNLFIS